MEHDKDLPRYCYVCNGRMMQHMYVCFTCMCKDYDILDEVIMYVDKHNLPARYSPSQPKYYSQWRNDPDLWTDEGL